MKEKNIMINMLTSDKLKALRELIAESSKEELAWMSGYIAGLLAKENQQVPAEVAPASSKPSVNKITIAYGTETGNAKSWLGILQPRLKRQASMLNWSALINIV